MAERWQQWMPFHIDRWRGSPSVQAMHPAAQMGYLNLLCSSWQSSDCSLSSDPVDLATESRLGDELWALYGPRILRKFVLQAGRWQNSVLFESWEEARRVYEKRKSGAVRTNTSRSAPAVRTHTERRADTQTLTGTVTTTKTKAKTYSLAKKRREVQAKPPCKTDINKARHKEFKAQIGLYWRSKNPGVEMPWGAPEGQALEIWLRESPTTTIEQFTGYLRNRFKSDANHTERPHLWIRHVTGYASEPLNKFKQPQSLNGGNNGTFKGKTESSLDAARAAIEAIENRVSTRSSGDSPSSEIGVRRLPSVCV